MGAAARRRGGQAGWTGHAGALWVLRSEPRSGIPARRSPSRVFDGPAHALPTPLLSPPVQKIVFLGLERVALRDCRRVSSEGVMALLQLSSLKRVVISRCPQVRRAGGRQASFWGIPSWGLLWQAGALSGCPLAREGFRAEHAGMAWPSGLQQRTRRACVRWAPACHCLLLWRVAGLEPPAPLTSCTANLLHRSPPAPLTSICPANLLPGLA